VRPLLVQELRSDPTRDPDEVFPCRQADLKNQLVARHGDGDRGE